VAAFRERDNEHSDFMKGGIFNDLLKDVKFVNKDFAPLGLLLDKYVRRSVGNSWFSGITH